MWQLALLLSSPALSNPGQSSNEWCFNPNFREPAPQVYDITYVVPEMPVWNVSARLDKASIIKINGRRNDSNRYYIRSGVLAPRGLSQKALYKFVRDQRISFSFYYKDLTHELVSVSLFFMDADLVQYNVVLEISTPRKIDRVYVQCMGGV